MYDVEVRELKVQRIMEMNKVYDDKIRELLKGNELALNLFDKITKINQHNQEEAQKLHKKQNRDFVILILSAILICIFAIISSSSLFLILIMFLGCFYVYKIFLNENSVDFLEFDEDECGYLSGCLEEKAEIREILNITDLMGKKYIFYKDSVVDVTHCFAINLDLLEENTENLRFVLMMYYYFEFERGEYQEPYLIIRHELYQEIKKVEEIDINEKN